jgi:phage-related protein
MKMKTRFMRIKRVYPTKYALSQSVKGKNKLGVVISKVEYLAGVGLNFIKYIVRVGIGIIIYVVRMGVSTIKKVIGLGLGFIKEAIGVITGYLKTIVKILINSIMLITLDKLFGLLLGAIFLASLKYAISGCLSVN